MTNFKRVLFVCFVSVCYGFAIAVTSAGNMVFSGYLVL